jgi:hypothetical protein
MQNYIMLTPKNTYFSMHILFQELKQLLLFFVYNLKGKINKLKILVSVFWTGNLLRGIPEVDECDSPRSVTRRKRHVAHNLDRFGPRGA